MASRGKRGCQPKQDGHGFAWANAGAPYAQRGEGDVGCHASFFATAGLSDAVRRGRNESDNRP
jgi:hypothetical protein